MSDDANTDVRVAVFLTHEQLALIFLGLLTVAENARRNGAKAKAIACHEVMADLSGQIDPYRR